MGKPKGFLEYVREPGEDRPPLKRLNDWNEFHNHLDEARLRNQAARCMECGTDTCHAGRLVNGMASGCPLHNLIPEFNELVYQGLWDLAYARLRKTSNFPEFTSRVCPAPCESAGCTLNGVVVRDTGQPPYAPVAIKSIEYAIITKAWAEGWVRPAQKPVRTGKRVAVIGSGPAGLAAADQLNSAGHDVVVYERADRPGGLLMYGIPNMKIEKHLILRRVKLLEEGGVRFVFGANIGGDGVDGVDARDLVQKEKFDAVVLCTGSTIPRDLKVEGRELKGIHFAVDYLTETTKALLDEHYEPRISAAGRKVVVIGGGDTGNDCTGSSLRQNNPDNAASIRHCEATVAAIIREQAGAGTGGDGDIVTQLEIMDRPAAFRDPLGAANPWPEWPKVLKTDYGQQEAIVVKQTFAREKGVELPADAADPRRWLTTVKRFVGDADGCVKEVVTVKVRWEKNERGAFVPVEQPGTEVVLPARLVLLAMGFTGPQQSLPKELGVALDARGNINAAHEDHRTSNPKVFAAGDCRRGQSLVVWAISEGRSAARECDRFLMGETTLP
jgi:glutamate synthase (NADPH/NADH) small chain